MLVEVFSVVVIVVEVGAVEEEMVDGSEIVEEGISDVLEVVVEEAAVKFSRIVLIFVRSIVDAGLFGSSAKALRQLSWV